MAHLDEAFKEYPVLPVLGKFYKYIILEVKNSHLGLGIIRLKLMTSTLHVMLDCELLLVTSNHLSRSSNV